MNDLTKLALEIALGTSALAALLRYTVKQAIQHFFATQTLKLTEDLKRVSKAQETELQLWSARQLELFKHLLEAKAVVIHQLVKSAGRLRRAIHGIGEERDVALIAILYEDYKEIFDTDPILPDRLFDAAHMFRRRAEKMKGACAVAGPKGQLDENLIKELDNSYTDLLREARFVLLPMNEAVATGLSQNLTEPHRSRMA
jgi:hypothetical protein